jgi:hypothetical protein
MVGVSINLYDECQPLENHHKIGLKAVVSFPMPNENWERGHSHFCSAEGFEKSDFRLGSKQETLMFFRRDIVATDTALIGHTFTLNKPHGIFSPSILRLVHQRRYVHEAQGAIWDYIFCGIPEAGAVCVSSVRTDLCGREAAGNCRPYRDRCLADLCKV